MIHRIVKVIGITSLIVTPAAAQFGILGGKKKGTSFQDLNEIAIEQGFGLVNADEMAKMEDFMESAINNPNFLEMFSFMGEEINKMMEELNQMDPEELQKEMEAIYSVLTSGVMVDAMVGMRDDILANLEATGLVPQDELEKFKEDPEYFEQHMRGAFDQIAGIVSDPSIFMAEAETFREMSEAYYDPEVLELSEMFDDGLIDDAVLEETRLRFLNNPDLTSFFGEDFKEALKDSMKWNEKMRETVNKQGSLAKLAGASLGKL